MTTRKKVTLRKMGGSVGATLPREYVDQLHLEAGDELYVMETDRGLLLTPYDPDFDQAMDAYERTARKYKNALRELAK